MNFRLALRYVSDFAQRLKSMSTRGGLYRAFQESPKVLGLDAFALHKGILSGVQGRMVFRVWTYPDA